MMIVASNSFTVSNVNDGTTVHIAYANSADGKDGFYVGGGRNYLQQSSTFKWPRLGEWHVDTETYQGHAVLTGTQTVNNSLYGFRYTNLPCVNSDVVVSFYAKAAESSRLHSEPYGGGGGSGATDFRLTTEWVRYSYKAHIGPTGTVYWWAVDTNIQMWVSMPKLELGTTATPWSPAPSEAHPTYMGTYTDYTQADSTNPAAYSWKLVQGPKGDSGTDGLPGKDGVGIKSTAVTYQSSTSGTTAPTGTWLTVPPTVAAGKFLWTRMIWTYTDGTTETGYSVGHIGADGSDGLPGKAGADGRTPYFHQAWADSSDGKTNFSTTDSLGKKYLGTYTDYVVADSKDSTKYKWTELVGAIEIGGTNLYLDTKDITNSNLWFAKQYWTKQPDKYNGLAVMQTIGNWSGLSQYIKVKTGDVYTFSLYARYASGTGVSSIYWTLNANPESGHANAQVSTYNNLVNLSEDWQRVSVTVTITADGYIRPRIERTSNNTNTLQVAGMKLEKGNKATAWSPAPEDNASAIDSLRTEVKALSFDTTNLLTVANAIPGYLDSTGVMQAGDAYSSAKWKKFMLGEDPSTAVPEGYAVVGTAIVGKDRVPDTEPEDVDPNTYTNHTMLGLVDVKPGESITFHQLDRTNLNTSHFHYVWYTSAKDVVSGGDNTSALFTLVVPANTAYLAISYSSSGKSKVEHGKSATVWTPSPADQQAELDNLADNTDSRLANLESNTDAETMADTVLSSDLFNSFKDLTKTESDYLKDALDTLKDANQATVSSIANLVIDKRKIQADVNTLVEANNDTEIVKINVRNWMNFDNTGLTIGKDNSPFSININNEQMSFIDSGATVAYVNNQKMYITDIEVNNSIILGHHKISSYSDGISTGITYAG